MEGVLVGGRKMRPNQTKALHMELHRILQIDESFSFFNNNHVSSTVIKKNISHLLPAHLQDP